MKINYGLTFMASLLLVGCSNTTYEIYDTTYSYQSSYFPNKNYEVKLPLKINKKTGETWRLIPAKEGKNFYVWQKVIELKLQNKSTVP